MEACLAPGSGCLITVRDYAHEARGRNPLTGTVETHVMRSKCYAISTDRLSALMREAGFDHVRRIDGAFYQPVLVGTKSLRAR